MKKEDLQALGLTDEQISKVMELKGKAVSAEERRANKAEQERDQWKERAETAEETLKGFDGVDVDKLKKDIEDWKSKAEQAEKDYNDRLYERDFADALDAELKEIEFTSEGAKKSVMAEVKDAGLKLKDGKIMGLNDLLGQIREKDPNAFATKDDGTPPARFTTKKSTPAKKPMTIEEIFKIKDASERQAAIADNVDLFNKGE